jgi:polyhydroxybutyrate depolymerase
MTRAGLVLAMAVAVAGCGEGDRPTPETPRPVVQPAPGDHTLRLDVGGVEREVLVHAPPAYRPGSPVPLVVVMHGRPSTPAEVRETSHMSETADAEGFLVAYPKGVNGGWRTRVGAPEADDLTFLRAMVDQLVETWSVDRARVFATGFSNGAAMSYRLGAEASDVFAAIAPVSGQFDDGGGTTGGGATAAPASPVSVISFMGNLDRGVAGISAGRHRWHTMAKCTPAEPEFADDSRRVSRIAATCADGSEVVDYTVNDMGHEWPGPANPTTAPDANALIWRFFEEHGRAR